LGILDIELGVLLGRCGNNESESSHSYLKVDAYRTTDTVIELRKVEDGANGAITGLLTIKLEAGDAAQLGAVAVANARQDIELSNVGAPIGGYSTVHDAADAVTASGITDSNFAKSLGSVVMKINIIVEVIDKTAKVIIFCSNNNRLADLYR
jgi:hypothetical protein